MNPSMRYADPRRHLVGLSFVVLLHVVVVYALLTGLAKKVVEGVRAPIETRVIEEVHKPPAPEVPLPAPPKLEAPPPPFVPPPEVQIQAPPQQPTITATTPTPPPAAADITPVAPTPPAPAAAAAPAPVSVSARVVCSNYANVMGEVAYPRDAIRQGIDKGDATIQFTVDASGTVKDVRVVSASHPIFARNSVRIVGEYRCQGQGHEVLVQVPFGYRLE